MRNVEQQAALGRQQRLDAAGHLIEAARQLTQLIFARLAGARAEKSPRPKHSTTERKRRTGDVK